MSRTIPALQVEILEMSAAHILEKRADELLKEGPWHMRHATRLRAIANLIRDGSMHAAIASVALGDWADVVKMAAPRTGSQAVIAEMKALLAEVE